MKSFTLVGKSLKKTLFGEWKSYCFTEVVGHFVMDSFGYSIEEKSICLTELVALIL